MATRKLSLDDQQKMMRATKARYTYAPRGAALKIFTCHDEEVLLAGPAGTGKSRGVLEKLHLVLAKYDGAKVAMCRKTRTSMTNSCLDMFQRHVLKPLDRVHFHKQDQQFNYPNGSVLAVVGLDEPKRIMSTEFDIIYIQEATDCTENDWEMCTTRLRSGVLGYQQLIGDCNPDKPTHWLKKRSDKKLTTMLLSTHEENPTLYNGFFKGVYYPQWTPHGEKYRAKLDRLTGARRSRLYLGQWVAAEGLVYEKWEPAVHMVNLKDLPSDWDRWDHYWSIDWGYTHPFVWKDYVESPYTGQLIMVREIYRTKQHVEDVAREIKLLTGHLYRPRAIVADHDPGDRATFERHTGYPVLPAYKDIKAGIGGVVSRLHHDWSLHGPGLLYARDVLIGPDNELKEAGLPMCTVEEYDGYVWDKKKADETNSKKDELPVDKDNHGMDSDRYLIAFADNLADDPEDLSGEILELGQKVCISPY